MKTKSSSRQSAGDYMANSYYKSVSLTMHMHSDHRYSLEIRVVHIVK
jgi:hypothetical protein